MPILVGQNGLVFDNSLNDYCLLIDTKSGANGDPFLFADLSIINKLRENRAAYCASLFKRSRTARSLSLWVPATPSGQ
jgi:hypothetical protein